MRYKKIMLLIIILTCLLAVSAVSAAENATDDIVGTDVASEDVVSVEEDQAIEQIDNDEILSTTDDGTFTALQNKINNAAAGSTIILKNDYTFDNGFNAQESDPDMGITISKPLTINGEGHTINAKSKSRIFYLTSTVTLKNIKFVNGNYDGMGGAILNDGGVNCKFISCEFINCKAWKYGGAISNLGSQCTIDSCKFSKSTADYGDAVFNDGKKCTISNCKFISCSGGSEGAVSNDGDNSKIISCEFAQCRNYVGAISNRGDNCIVKSCKFTGIICIEAPGSIVENFRGLKFSISSCKFVDCNSRDGNIICNYGKMAAISSCTFINCFYNLDTISSKYASSNIIDFKLSLVKVKKSAKKLNLIVHLKKGKSPLKNKKVVFKFNGKKYTAKTNKKGVAKVTIKSSVLKKLKVGKKITYQATYGNNIIKQSVKVKK